MAKIPYCLSASASGRRQGPGPTADSPENLPSAILRWNDCNLTELRSDEYSKEHAA